jgi:hypothetical protein
MVIVRKTDEKIVVGLTVTDALVNMTKRDLLLSENLPFWKVKGAKDCYVFAKPYRKIDARDSFILPFFKTKRT